MRGVYALLNKKLREVCTEYSVPMPELKLSTMKKANGTFSYSYNRFDFPRAKTPDAILACTFDRTIKVSKYIVEHYTFKEAQTTLLHEIAHYLDLVFNQSTGHTKSFKDICVALGGTMNQGLATGIHSEAASADYVSKKMYYMYECSCGSAKRKTYRKLSERTLHSSRCGRCKQMMYNWTVTKEGM